MITRTQVTQAQQKAARMIIDAGIALTDAEIAGLEVADFGLDQLETIGLEIVTYINTDRYCAKELVLFPHQTCPEHRHPDVDTERGKMETFRVRKGTVFLYVDGEATGTPNAIIPEARKSYFTVFHEIVLLAGEQYTLSPNTLHWFQAGKEGAIVSEFSSTSRDGSDIFTDPGIARIPQVDESR